MRRKLGLFIAKACFNILRRCSKNRLHISDLCFWNKKQIIGGLFESMFTGVPYKRLLAKAVPWSRYGTITTLYPGSHTPPIQFSHWTENKQKSHLHHHHHHHHHQTSRKPKKTMEEGTGLDASRLELWLQLLRMGCEAGSMRLAQHPHIYLLLPLTWDKQHEKHVANITGT